MTTAFEEDILAELRERDLEVHELREALQCRGHQAGHEETYEHLVRLESRGDVWVNTGHNAAHRTWGGA